ncbi:Uncharacterized protein DAT39_006957 [Clarias magur]|uniref:Uncharacterized protein n=1 Tax=Clarias magur TaxID=1594786 RepID=A0A8J4UPC7_CLAMG|nr:Uncharacterized protein DAT39_006957 [Clarias magur]
MSVSKKYRTIQNQSSKDLKLGKVKAWKAVTRALFFLLKRRRLVSKACSECGHAQSALIPPHEALRHHQE